MMRTLVGRTLYEKRWFLAGWAIVFSVMSTLVLMFYPSFSSGGGFDEVAKSLPSQLQGFIGDPSVFQTINGFVTSQVYDVRMSLLIIIMALVLATGLTVKEEENGDLRTTLSTSLGRTRLSLEKAIAASIIIVLLNLITTGGIYVGIAALGETLSHELLWKLFGLSCLFGITAFTIPYGIALATGRRSITMFIGLFVAIGSYVLTTFARSVDWLQDWDKLSLVHYYDTAGLRTNDFDLLNIIVLLAIATVMLTIGIFFFRRRDIT